MNARQFLLLTVVLLLGSGCSISREWKAANQQPTHPRDITGAWIGTWQNSNNSHYSSLRDGIRGSVQGLVAGHLQRHL
jgi:outer membrane biogenesis lipoprotein LolB